jgi:DNA-binding MarR family transcriptional regulator
VLKAGSWIDEKIKKALKPFNLTHAQLNTLYILFENQPDPVSANDLKERILVSNPDVTRMLDRLVQKEYITRETCPHNRRKIDICLTDNGKNIFKEAHESAKKAIGNFLEDFITTVEAEELRRILRKIRD